MSGTLTNLGTVSLGAVVPGVASPVALLLAQLQAQLAGALALAARLKVQPPSLAVNLDAVLKLVAGLQAAIALKMPYVDLQISAVAVLIAQLQVKIKALLAIQTLLVTGGVGVYEYVGDVPSFGRAVSATLPGTLNSESACYSLMLVAQAQETITAMKGLFIHG